MARQPLIPALLLALAAAGCSVGPASKAEVISASEKEVVILSDGLAGPFRTAEEQCGRFGKKAELRGRVDRSAKQLYYYNCL